jgi:DinB family protein
MNSIDVLTDAFERVRDAVYPAVSGLTSDELAYRPADESNSIAWLVWHLTRIQDDHVADLRGKPQVWVERGWADRFALPLDVSDTGYGHDADAVASVTADAPSLLGYFEDVHEATVAYLGTITDKDLDRVVDRRWDPPVTLGIRLVSVVADDLQHVGQASYVRGIVQRR